MACVICGLLWHLGMYNMWIFKGSNMNDCLNERKWICSSIHIFIFGFILQSTHKLRTINHLIIINQRKYSKQRTPNTNEILHNHCGRYYSILFLVLFAHNVCLVGGCFSVYCDFRLTGPVAVCVCVIQLLPFSRYYHRRHCSAAVCVW